MLAYPLNPGQRVVMIPLLMNSPAKSHLVTIEPCLEEAKVLVTHIQSSLMQKRNRRFKKVFTDLADGDSAVGLLAFYLWRRRARR